MTASGWPLFDLRPGSRSQFDAWPSKARESCAPIVFWVFAAADVALDSAGGTGGVNVTEPGSGSARPRFENAGSVSYGNRFFKIVVGASGSFFERKSAHARRPLRTP